MILTIATLIGMLPTAISGVSALTDLVAKMQSEGRTETTPQEAADLVAAFSRLNISEAGFERQFGIS